MINIYINITKIINFPKYKTSLYSFIIIMKKNKKIYIII